MTCHQCMGLGHYYARRFNSQEWVDITCLRCNGELADQYQAQLDAIPPHVRTTPAPRVPRRRGFNLTCVMFGHWWHSSLSRRTCIRCGKATPPHREAS